MCWYYMAIASVVSASLTASSFADEEHIDSAENVIREWVDTFNKNDPEKHLEFYERSDNMEVITSSGFRYRGYKAVQKAYRDNYKQVRFYDSTAKGISTRIVGDTAIVSFEHLFKIRFLADNSRWQVHIRTTSVLHQIKGEWKIILEHSSSIRGIERITRIED